MYTFCVYEVNGRLRAEEALVTRAQVRDLETKERAHEKSVFWWSYIKSVLSKLSLMKFLLFPPPESPYQGWCQWSSFPVSGSLTNGPVTGADTLGGTARTQRTGAP